MTFAQNQAPTFIKQPQNGKVTANSTTNANIYTAGGNGSKITSIVCTTNSSAAVTVTLSILNTSVLYTLGTISIPANAGTNTTTPSMQVLTNSQLPNLPVDSDGNPYLFLISGDNLQVSLGAAITSPNVATFIVTGGDF